MSHDNGDRVPRDQRQHALARVAEAQGELFEPLGITHRTFLDPDNPNRAGVLFEVPDMAAFHAVVQSAAGAEAMKHDGVRPETLVLLVAT